MSRALGALSSICVGLCLSCAAPPGPPDPAPSLLPRAEIPLDGLTRRVASLRRRMRTRGYGESVAQTRLLVLEGAGVAVPLDLPRGRCATFVALGGGELRQLELALFDAQGERVLEDRAEGEGGLAHVCPPLVGDARTAAYYLTLLARRGSGAVQLVAFLSPVGQGQGFQDLFQGLLAPVVAANSVISELDALRDSLRDRGLLPLSQNVVGALPSAGALRATERLSRDHCYVAIAATGQGVEDADFFLFDPSGAEVARDLERGPSPRVQHCPSVSGRFSFELRAYRGSGSAGFVVLEGAPNAPLPGIQRALSSPDAGLDVAGGARAALSPVLAALLEEGYSEPTWVVSDGSLGPGEVRTEEVILGPSCGVVVGSAARQDADLDLYLVDAAGRVLDRDTRVRALARVVACPSQPTPFRVQVKLYGHAGPFALVSLRAPPEAQRVREVRLLQAERELLARTPVRVSRQVRQLGERRSVSSTERIRAGRCVGFAAGGDASLEDLDLFLRSESGDLLASDTGPAPWAALRYCVQEEEQVTLELRAYRGAGEVVVDRLEGAP
ncbi:MAG: hypothetical protein GXP55_11515 [Deltaproteobacteria bacterium]|nr:hypothetical protein [Deltaproteobacteria bacterium]